MEQKRALPTKPQSESPITQKLDYASPKATFIPLKLEERLIGCGKDDVEVLTCNDFIEGS